MDYNVDIYNGEEKVFTLYNIHDKISENNLEIFEAKKKKVVEFLQQPSFFRVLASLKKICKDFDICVDGDFRYINMQELLDDITILPIEIIIKYDEINIINSKSQTATLKDIFVRFTMCINKSNEIWIKEAYMHGVRSTMYDYEIYSGYIHSHLPSRQKRVPEFNNFCLGDGPIKLVLIEMSHPKRFNFIKFEGFLYQIKSYLSWESIEGGPHIRLENRKQMRNSNIATNFNCFSRYHNDNYLTIVIDYMNKNINEFLKYVKISFSPDKKDINVDIVGSDEQKIIDIISTIRDERLIENSLFVMKTEDGYSNLEAGARIFTSSELVNKNMFKFKNEFVTFKVLSEDKEKFTPKKVLNPLFKTKVLNYIKYLIKLKIKNDSNKTKGISSKEENGYYRIKEQENTSIYI